MAVDIGVLAKFGIGDSGGVATRLIDVDPGESVTAVNEQEDANGIKGSRSRRDARVRPAGIRVGGSFTWAPNVVEWQQVLPYIFGGSTFNGTLGSTMAETLPSFVVQKQLASGKVFTYTGLMVNSATIRIMPNTAVKLTIDCLGLDRQEGSSFPSITLSEADQFYMGHEASTITVGGTTYTSVMEATITANNAVRLRYPLGSRKPTLAYPTDRAVGVQMTLAEGDITWTNSGGELTGPYVDASPAVSIGLAAANDSLTFLMNAVRMTHADPVISDRGEILHRLAGTAYKKAAQNLEELLITLVQA